MKKVISFPNFGNYYIPLKEFLKKITNCKVITSPKNTRRTLEIGSKHSPDFVCLPFKYTLGNYIESLDSGANVLVQAGGGCRYGYYGEVQEQILKDLGYDFKFINLMDNGSFSLMKFYKSAKELNPKLKFFKFMYYVLVTLTSMICMDRLDRYIRKNLKYEINKGTINKIKDRFLRFIPNNFKIIKMIRLYLRNKKDIKFNLDKKINTNATLKIGLLGELFSLIEHSSSYNIEEYLMDKGIEVRRYTDITYLLIEKKFNERNILKKAKSFSKFKLGADSSDNIAHAIDMSYEGFDGIIHMKPFSCSPEINTVPILQKVSEEYDIPVLFLTFDSQYAKGAIDTRIEAFIDMLIMRKEREADNEKVLSRS